MLLTLFIAAVAGYALGALPFGYWVARSRGIDIFQHGSKNPGATNVRRVLGKGPGNLVFFLDALKGAVATGWPLAVGRTGWIELFTAYSLESAVVGLIAGLVGHSFSCFTRFKGGKGVATSVGGFAVLMPVVLVIAAAVWALTFFTTRYVSLASMLAALTLPSAAYALREPRLLLSISGAVALFVILRHRTNLSRLLNGTETKFVKKGRA